MGIINHGAFIDTYNYVELIKAQANQGAPKKIVGSRPSLKKINNSKNKTRVLKKR